MDMLTGVNHIAVLTADLDRFVEFYCDVFDLDVVFREDTPAFSHAIIRTGPTSWLHPAQVNGSIHADALPTMFERGHLDHLALTAASTASFDAVRQRLVARHATTGEIDDLGAFHSIWFTDPDGMRVEVVNIIDERLDGIHAPRPAGTGRLTTSEGPSGVPGGREDPLPARLSPVRAPGRTRR